MSRITHTIDGNLARVTLNDPPQNRLTQEMFDDLGDDRRCRPQRAPGRRSLGSARRTISTRAIPIPMRLAA